MGMNEDPVLTLSLVASEDLSTYQYYGVVMTTTDMNCERVDGTTDHPIGILLNAPASGEMALVGVIGVFPVKTSEAVATNSQVLIDSDGLGAPFEGDTDTTAYCIGTCIRASGGTSGEKALVAVNCCNPFKGEE